MSEFSPEHAALNGWEPMETAPLDGGDVWLFDADAEPAQYVGHYVDDPNGSYWAYAEELVNEVAGQATPSHWRPLPPPPFIRGAGS